MRMSTCLFSHFHIHGSLTCITFSKVATSMSLSPIWSNVNWIKCREEYEKSSKCINFNCLHYEKQIESNANHLSTSIIFLVIKIDKILFKIDNVTRKFKYIDHIIINWKGDVRKKKKIEYKNLMNNFAFQKVRRIIFLIKK